MMYDTERRSSALKKKTLFSIYRRRRVWRNVSLLHELLSCFSKSAFVAVIVDIDIEPGPRLVIAE